MKKIEICSKFKIVSIYRTLGRIKVQKNIKHPIPLPIELYREDRNGKDSSYQREPLPDPANESGIYPINSVSEPENGGLGL
ncbi:hypothetical protein LEP1GSC058_2254 [Leptospira fainei serovar Hurstbridge str. BUT 6]|uniref:Uncharacterized protein n=1 Tax=Leptospira fainei serovar Hurstbridge str. BUT 6 TaxID=1193011 RepID=S3VGN3_9LEPT|nr:hypothetical protein [Leptospira fainei]EPG75615.1 hypothetical protein LEP1GSC058_2254 [Leptospira fainei serovar Hurstbridge str. BUT 6]